MTALPGAWTLRDELQRLLQETDPFRPLDSLETVVVLTYLKRYVPVPEDATGDRPTTIEGWVAWADPHSSGS